MSFDYEAFRLLLGNLTYPRTFDEDNQEMAFYLEDMRLNSTYETELYHTVSSKVKKIPSDQLDNTLSTGTAFQTTAINPPDSEVTKDSVTFRLPDGVASANTLRMVEISSRFQMLGGVSPDFNETPLLRFHVPDLDMTGKTLKILMTINVRRA